MNKSWPKDGLKPNDLVNWGGVRGVVTSVTAPKDGYPIQVVFPSVKMVVAFRADGTFLDWHKTSDLQFIKRPKPNMLGRVKQWLSKFKKAEAKNVEKQNES